MNKSLLCNVENSEDNDIAVILAHLYEKESNFFRVTHIAS